MAEPEKAWVWDGGLFVSEYTVIGRTPKGIRVMDHGSPGQIVEKGDTRIFFDKKVAKEAIGGHVAVLVKQLEDELAHVRKYLTGELGIPIHVVPTAHFKLDIDAASVES